jgi:RHS repeat-associated protein
VDLPDGRTIEYVHDPLGRRIAKKIDGTTVEKYLWSGRTALLAVFDGANNLLMRFEYADGRMPVAMTRGGARYYLACDQVGTLRVVTDSTGAVVKRIDHDSFGNVVADTNPAFSVPFGFAGGLHDRDTGLVRFGYRDYDPETGRWTAKDPILFAGGDVDLYGYCLNDSVNWADSK